LNIQPEECRAVILFHTKSTPYTVRLDQSVYNHVTSGTIFNSDFLLFDPVSVENVYEVNVFGTFTARTSLIVSWENGALAVLIQNMNLLRIS